VEALLSLEKERIEMEKRELVIQKYYNPNHQSGNALTGVSGAQIAQTSLAIPYNSSFTSLPNFR
jgi:hypothetical protein